MKWNYGKPTSEKTRAEIELTDTFDYIREIEDRLRKIKAVVDSLYIKAQINHGMTEGGEVKEHMNEQTARETLEKQLQLLSERSQECRDEATLAAMSAEMVAISRLLLGP